MRASGLFGIVEVCLEHDNSHIAGLLFDRIGYAGHPLDDKEAPPATGYNPNHEGKACKTDSGHGKRKNQANIVDSDGTWPAGP